MLETHRARVTSLEVLLFNRPTGGILPNISKLPTLCDQCNDYHDVLIKRQLISNKVHDTPENIPFPSTEVTVAVQREDDSPRIHGTIIG